MASPADFDLHPVSRIQFHKVRDYSGSSGESEVGSRCRACNAEMSVVVGFEVVVIGEVRYVRLVIVACRDAFHGTANKDKRRLCVVLRWVLDHLLFWTS